MGRCGRFGITPLLPSQAVSTLFANPIEKKRGWEEGICYGHVWGALVPGVVKYVKMVGYPNTVGCPYALNTQDEEEERSQPTGKKEERT